MSATISGRGKQRKHGQDLNQNQNQMGGGQMAMPPNGAAPNAAFVTPTVPVAHPAYSQDFRAPHVGGGSEYPPQQSGQHPSMVLPHGANIQHEQTSQYAMQGVQGMPQNNMQQQQPRQGMQQWQPVPPQQQPHQQHMMQQQHSGMAPAHMNRGAPQQARSYPTQAPQPVVQGFYPTAAPGYYIAAPNMYQQQQYSPEAYAAYAAQHQQQQFYNQMMSQQQPQPQHQMQQQAQPLQQQGGGAPGGVGTGAQMGGGVPPTQHAPMHGGVPPASGAPMHQGPVPVSVPTPAPLPTLPNYTPIMHQQHLQRQPQPQSQSQSSVPAPVVPKKKNILMIVDPNTKEVVNQNELEASKREEDAPKADKEEAKGTDEMDSAAPEVKKQFAEAILEQTTKPEKPAPAPASVAPAKQQNKCLFSLEQLEQFGLKDKVAHVATPPAPAPAAAAPVAAEAAPAAEDKQPVSEEKPAKQATPEVTLAEMPAETNNDEQVDETQLAEVSVHEEPASSSSEKNASNDSAICVQSPVTQPTPTAVEEEKVVPVEEPAPVAAAADEEPAVEEKQEEEEKEAAEEPVTVEEPLHKKLEQLVIAESASQEEAESEPSTPAPVTPSVSETATALAEEEEEDAEKAEAAREEARQQRRAELEAEIAKNMEDIEQFNEGLKRYNREYLYNVRDLEKDFHVTPCPLTPEELKGYGICRSLVSNEPKRKQDGQGGFMPGWARSGGGPRGGGAKAYQGRQSEQHQRGGGNKHGPNRKLPPSIRPSIERRVETNVQLHKAEQAWKPEKVTETDPELEADEVKKQEIKKKLLLKTIRSLFNKITPTTKDALINEFLAHKVYESPALNDVISVIFDKAVEEPKFCPLYSNMCFTQVSEELKLNNNVSHFRNAILVRAQETFTTKNLDEFVAEKKAEIEAETDEKKKKEKQIELLEAQVKFRRRKFGNITFIGQLYLQNLISVRIILFCVVDLLKSVTEKPANLEGYEADEDAVDCAVRLLETIGKRLQAEASAQAAAQAANKPTAPKSIPRGQPVQPKQQQQGPPQQIFPIDMTFQTLEGAIPIVSSRIKFMIMNLVELRKNGWIPRKGQDAGPKKLDEIKKDIQKEQMENQQAAQAYERKQSRQEPMGRGMGGGGGHGGHGGGYGGGGPNPKRQIIQRNSQDRGNVDDRRAQAHKTSSLAATKAPPKKGVSLSSVTASDKGSLGGGSKKWSTGASGGSENSKKEDRAAAIQQTSRFMHGQRSSSAASMKEDEGASASGNATQANSEDEREQNEKREKQEAEITKRVVCDVGDYCDGEIKLEEVRDEIFKYSENEEKYGKPSLQTIFKCFMAAAVKKSTKAPELAAKFGHVLAFCLLKKTWTDEEKEKVSDKDKKAVEDKENKQREEILKGVAESCREVVEQEQWEDAPKIWDIFAEVLINAHMPEEGLYVGGHPTLADFKDAFLNAGKDTRKPYTLFVLVLKRLAELHHKRDKDGAMELMSWVMSECDTIVKKMDAKKLTKALEETNTNFDENLHKIMHQQ